MENENAAHKPLSPQVEHWILVHACTVAYWQGVTGSGTTELDEGMIQAWNALGLLHAISHAELDKLGPGHLAWCTLDTVPPPQGSLLVEIEWGLT